jgi:hypothetical protein
MATGSGRRNVAARFPPRWYAVGSDTLDSTAQLIIFNRYAQRASFEPTVPLLHWHYSERPVPHHKMDLGADGSVKLKFKNVFQVCWPCLAGAGYDTRLKTWLSPERLSETACKQTQNGEADPFDLRRRRRTKAVYPRVSRYASQNNPARDANDQQQQCPPA